MTPRTATLIGLTAILMWSLLAVMTVATGYAKASANIALAALLIAGGGLIAAKDMVSRR
jgi:hypothetical protein